MRNNTHTHLVGGAANVTRYLDFNGATETFTLCGVDELQAAAVATVFTRVTSLGVTQEVTLTVGDYSESFASAVKVDERSGRIVGWKPAKLGNLGAALNATPASTDMTVSTEDAYVAHFSAQQVKSKSALDLVQSRALSRMRRQWHRAGKQKAPVVEAKAAWGAFALATERC